MRSHFELYHPVYWQHDPWYRRSWYLFIQATTLAVLFLIFIEPLPSTIRTPMAKWIEPPQSGSNYQDFVICMNEQSPIRERGDACDKLIKSSSLSRTDLARAYYSRGLKLDSDGRVREAILDLSSALEFNHDKVIYYHRGDLFLKMRKFTEAKTDYMKSLSMDLSFAEPHVGLASIYIENGSLDKAEAELRQAIILKPKLAIAHYYFGQYYLLKRNYDSAVSSFTSAILNSEFPSATYYVSRADAYLQQKNLQFSRADIDRAKIISPLDQGLIEFEPKLLQAEFLKKSKYYQGSP